LIKVNDDLENKILEAEKLSKELTTTHSKYQLGIIIATICVLIVNIVICFVGCFCFRREPNEVDDSQEKRSYEIQNDDIISVERSRDLTAHSPFQCFSEALSQILPKRKQEAQEDNQNNISEWKIQKYFRAVHEEQVNETPSKSSVQSQNESYVYSRTVSVQWSEP